MYPENNVLTYIRSVVAALRYCNDDDRKDHRDDWIHAFLKIISVK